MRWLFSLLVVVPLGFRGCEAILDSTSNGDSDVDVDRDNGPAVVPDADRDIDVDVGPAQPDLDVDTDRDIDVDVQKDTASKKTRRPTSLRRRNIFFANDSAARRLTESPMKRQAWICIESF